MDNPSRVTPVDQVATTGQASFERPSQAAPDLWSLRDLLSFIVFALASLPISYVVVFGGYYALKFLLGWEAPFGTLRENTFLVLTVQTAFYGFLAAYIYLMLVVNHRQPFWSALKWRNPTSHQTVRFVLGGVLMAFAVSFVPALLPEKHSFPLERLFSSPASAYAIGVFAIFIAPFMEELIFRGVLFSIFERQVGPWFAVVSTSLLFAGLHVSEYWGAWHHVFMILVVGLVFSLARMLTGSLAPSVILHLAYNATQMAVLFLGTHRFQTMHGLLVR